MKNGIILGFVLVFMLGFKSNSHKLSLTKDKQQDSFCFRLLDSETNQPLWNQVIEVPKFEEMKNKDLKGNKKYFRCGYGQERRNYKTITTNKNGEFYLSKNDILNRITTSIYIPANGRYIRINKFLKNRLSIPRHRCGYGQSQLLGFDSYFLDSNYVEKVRYLQNETVKEKYDKFDLYTCPNESWNKAKDFVETVNKDHYLSSQKNLWVETWKEFEKNIGDDLKTNPNADIWFQYVVAIIKQFGVLDMKLKPLIEFFDEAEKTEKKYNILFAIFKIRYHHISKNLKVDVEEEEKIKKVLNIFYKEHNNYIQNFTDSSHYRDVLKRKLIQYESFYKFDGNMKNNSNATKRLRMID